MIQEARWVALRVPHRELETMIATSREFVFAAAEDCRNQDTVRTIFRLTLTGLPRGTSTKLPSVTETSPCGA